MLLHTLVKEFICGTPHRKEKRQRLSQAISFDGWMKEWRFKEIKGLVSEVASAPDLKGVDD